MHQLNSNMMQLGQQVLSVRAEAEKAVDATADSSEAMAQQRATIAALTQALTQLENVNRSLSSTMRESVSETVNQVEKFERQTERVRSASESTGQWVTSLSQHMQNQLTQLSREMERTMSQKVVAPAPVVTAHAMAPVSQTVSKASTAVSAPAQRAAAGPDALQKLRDMAARSQQLGTAPVAEKSATGSFADNAASLAPKAGTASAAPRRTDNELISSLSQIIQQLEDTAGQAAATDALKRKTKV
jgi:hypothetical protein